MVSHNIYLKINDKNTLIKYTFFAIFVKPLPNQKYLFFVIVEIFHLDSFQKPRTFILSNIWYANQKSNWSVFLFFASWRVSPKVVFRGPYTFDSGRSTFIRSWLLISEFVWKYSFLVPNYHDWFPSLSFFLFLFWIPMWKHLDIKSRISQTDRSKATVIKKKLTGVSFFKFVQMCWTAVQRSSFKNEIITRVGPMVGSVVKP